MDAVYTEKYKNCLISVYQDDDTQSPEEWGDDNLFLTGYHRDFTVESKIISKAECIALSTGDDDGDESMATRRKELQGLYHYFGLEAYIHGGVVLALSQEGNFIDRNWDVSQLGMVFVSKKETKSRDKAKKLAEGLIKTWNLYLSGSVYGFMTTDEKNGIDIGSCWGFYGDYDESGIINEAKSSIDFYLKKKRKQAINKTKDLSKTMLGELLAHNDEGIRRNAIGILKILQKRSV